MPTEEQKKAKAEYMRNYNKEKIICEKCGSSHRRDGKKTHFCGVRFVLGEDGLMNMSKEAEKHYSKVFSLKN